MTATIQSAAMTDPTAKQTAQFALCIHHISGGDFDATEDECRRLLIFARAVLAEPLTAIPRLNCKTCGVVDGLDLVCVCPPASAPPEALSSEELRGLAWQLRSLRTALLEVTDILDTMGNARDSEVCPDIWQKLDCEAAIGRARAALAAPSTPATQAQAIPESDPPIQWPHAWSCSREAKGHGRCVAWCGVESSCVSSPERAPSTPAAEHKQCPVCDDWLCPKQSSAPSTPAKPVVTEFNVGRWCLSEDECIAQKINFAAYERGVADAAEAFGRAP